MLNFDVFGALFNSYLIASQMNSWMGKFLNTRFCACWALGGSHSFVRWVLEEMWVFKHEGFVLVGHFTHSFVRWIPKYKVLCCAQESHFSFTMWICEGGEFSKHKVLCLLDMSLVSNSWHGFWIRIQILMRYLASICDTSYELDSGKWRGITSIQWELWVGIWKTVRYHIHSLWFMSWNLENSEVYCIHSSWVISWNLKKYWGICTYYQESMLLEPMGIGEDSI